MFLLGAAGCGSGGGGSADPSRSESASASHAAAEPTGLLYSAKSATFSSIWAVEHGCPATLLIDVTDSGPQLRNPETDGNGNAENGTAWPRLSWHPPCSGITQEITFDGSPVAKVSGSQTQSSCQTSAEQSRRTGSGLKGYRISALTAGEEFCEYYHASSAGRSLDRVILMRVESLSSSNPIEVTWSVTDWALASASQTPPASGGALLYADQAFVVGDRKDCVTASVSLHFPDSPSVGYGQTSGDIVYFPACLGGSGKIRFGGPAAPVDGNPGASACEHAAAGSGENSLDVDLTALDVGSQYCEFSSAMESVVLAKVVSITKSPVSISFSVTRWQAPVTK